MTNETKKSEVIDWNAPFRAEDFECLIDNDYSEMDERACRVANHCFREIVEKMLTVGEYKFSTVINHKGDPCLWMYKADGEGMGLGKESLDKIWKEYF